MYGGVVDLDARATIPGDALRVPPVLAFGLLHRARALGTSARRRLRSRIADVVACGVGCAADEVAVLAEAQAQGGAATRTRPAHGRRRSLGHPFRHLALDEPLVEAQSDRARLVLARQVIVRHQLRWQHAVDERLDALAV